MVRSLRPALVLAAATIGSACARSASAPVAAAPAAAEPGPPPAPPPASGPLQIRVVYPREMQRVITNDTTYIYASPAERIQSRDSAFIFGSVGRGDARLTINGVVIPVYRTGAWLAWLPLPNDTIARFELVAQAPGDSARATFIAYLPPRYQAPVAATVWVDTTSFFPAGTQWVRPGEELRLAVRAAAGATVQMVLPDRRVISFVPDSAPDERPWGEIAFGTAMSSTAPAPVPVRYVARWTGPLGPDPGPVMAPLPVPPPDSGWATVEASRGADTVRHRWPLRVGVIDPASLPVVVVNDDTAGLGRADSSLAGRPSPGGTYHWFFPTGTVAAVSGRWNGQVRLQLSQSSVAWVDAVDVQPLPPQRPRPAGVALSPRLVPGDQSVTLRIPMSERMPFRVDETERTLALRLYGVAADMDWVRYGGTDPLVRLISFSQPLADETVMTVELTRPVWGYRTRWDGTTLLLEIRRPPMIDPRRPLAGRRIALDPGHPPAGATGPTGLPESAVVLEIARVAKRMFESQGAQAVMVRSNDSAVDLNDRLRIAERADADVLISIHANALPDGMNPFVNSGTSVYYFQPRSAPLARDLNRALVRRFGSRDLGMGRGDLAMVRITWMPSALTEGLFIMVPDQEAVLASPDGQRRYAEALVDGVRAFLAEYAAK